MSKKEQMGVLKYEEKRREGSYDLLQWRKADLEPQPLARDVCRLEERIRLAWPNRGRETTLEIKKKN